ncbi:hypothetical protein [Nocardioides marmotae]|uniref:hypothetical protein n=1 Tax=Nocardioides marmotae TaxID=2663857 RepID=UPI0012B65FAB|nr:hypothetical protein [Nocardioides marmotae]MBC9735479.1 hypothetical protein [Nocardioides marmotae]MTB86576.1 hypothetical protein [Nocardioides marmotae]
MSVSAARPARSSRGLRTLVAALALALAGSLSGCSLVDRLGGPDPVEAENPSAAAAQAAYDSQFTRDGTFQSHIKIDGMDFVYTLWPTKSTPRTNEWYPRGNKFFSFTFQVYDMNRKLRDPFRTKRKAYLGNIKVTSRTITTGGGRTQRPYKLNAEASRITFDPEAVTHPEHGMLITSPKGSFEIRNQKIGPVSEDTRGIELTFVAEVHYERAPGSGRFVAKKIKQTVPIAIFESDTPTQVGKIPINAN